MDNYSDAGGPAYAHTGVEGCRVDELMYRVCRAVVGRGNPLSRYHCTTTTRSKFCVPLSFAVSLQATGEILTPSFHPIVSLGC
jgi:hypothetical protein